VIATLARGDERATRLMKVEGVGPLIATALIAAVGDARQFHRGRELSDVMWLTEPPSNGATARLRHCATAQPRGPLASRRRVFDRARVMCEPGPRLRRAA
jgi:transposase